MAVLTEKYCYCYSSGTSIFNLGCCDEMGSYSRTHHYQQLVEGKETGYYVVRIDHVFVQSLKICGIKRAGIMAYAILNYFGPPPFNIAVPYTMIRVHVQGRKQLLESKNQWKNNIIQLAKNNNAIVTPSEQRTTNQQCTMAVTVTDEIKLCLMMLMIQMMNYIIVIMKGPKQIRGMKMMTSTKMAV